MNKIDIEKLEQKLEKCKKISIDEVNANDIEDISNNTRTAESCITNVIKSIYE